MIVHAMSSTMWQSFVAYRYKPFCLPGCHQFRGAVGRAVIHDQPLKVTEGLHLEAVVTAMQGMSTIEGWCKDSENG